MRVLNLQRDARRVKATYTRIFAYLDEVESTLGVVDVSLNLGRASAPERVEIDDFIP